MINNLVNLIPVHYCHQLNEFKCITLVELLPYPLFILWESYPLLHELLYCWFLIYLDISTITHITFLLSLLDLLIPVYLITNNNLYDLIPKHGYHLINYFECSTLEKRLLLQMLPLWLILCLFTCFIISGWITWTVISM